MNSEKRVKLWVSYGLREQVEVRAFNNLEMVGNRPSPFVWNQEASENDHSEDYINYIRNTFLGAEFLTGYEVLDVHDNPQFWNSGKARGTADAVVVQSPQLSRSQDVVKLVYELKKVRSRSLQLIQTSQIQYCLS